MERLAAILSLSAQYFLYAFLGEDLFKYYEFFSGGGMVRAGLGPKWLCKFANDLDPVKAETYIKNWGQEGLSVKDVREVRLPELPGRADLAWASFPCQDVSCAGNGLGLGTKLGRIRTRSGTFWSFIGLMAKLKKKSRAPKLIVIENVLGLLNSNDGNDFCSVASELARLDYRFGAIVVDARHFVPQSRPRVFIVAIQRSQKIPPSICAAEPIRPWHPDSVLRAREMLPHKVAKNWIWFNPGIPTVSKRRLIDVLSEESTAESWHSKVQTKRLISLMSKRHRAKLRDAKRLKKQVVGTLFLRMRPEQGINRQRAEINFTEVAGCIRTPMGGGSRVRILQVNGQDVRSRLLTPREAARLMGLKSSYKLPAGYEDAFRVLGDGVAPPAVAFVKARILEPVLLSKMC